MATLKEFLNVHLPSDKVLNRKPVSADTIISKNRGTNVRKIRGRSVNVAETPKIGEEIYVRQGDGTELSYKILKVIYNETGAPARAVVALPGGADRRIVRLNVRK